jgi:hypothetical protein
MLLTQHHKHIGVQVVYSVLYYYQSALGLSLIGSVIKCTLCMCVKLLSSNFTMCITTAVSVATTGWMLVTHW